MDILKGKRLILGSASPRRKELLQGLNIDFKVDACTDFKERIPSGIPPREVPARLAEGKSLGFHRPLEADEWLLTADTVVIIPDAEGKDGGRILGKPRSEDEACAMLRALSGRWHEVVSAVTLRGPDGALQTCSDVARVHFKTLSEEEIACYVRTCRPLDKAGAYGIQEWIGLIGIDRIEGSFYTVMGLPVHRVYGMLGADPSA